MARLCKEQGGRAREDFVPQQDMDLRMFKADLPEFIIAAGRAARPIDYCP